MKLFEFMSVLNNNIFHFYMQSKSNFINGIFSVLLLKTQTW